MRRLSHPYQDIFLHDAVLAACRRFPSQTAIVDTSNDRRITYAQYGDLVEILARNFAAHTRPGDVIAIYLPNSWEFAAACHASTLAGCSPTPFNPSYREREVRYQLEQSAATILVTDGPLIKDMDLAGLPALRHVFTTRTHASGCLSFAELLKPSTQPLPAPERSAAETIAALPFSSGTTGMPKGVMLSHQNLVSNVYQFIRPDEAASPHPAEITLVFLPLYHIYGLNVLMNPLLVLGGTLVLMPRFDADRTCDLIARERITWLPMVPPVMNSLCQAAEAGRFPKDHVVRYTKSGAAPLAPELPRRFTALTGIPVAQGYGMTEASPVTHVGFIEPDRYRPDTIGVAVAETRCKILCDDGNEIDVTAPQPDREMLSGELLMRGPQFMLGYLNAPDATAAVMRDGWYHSGDIARLDAAGFTQIVDRRKELIKYNGFPIAPAEVEACLLEHPKVRDVGVIGRPDHSTGELPIAFVVLRSGDPGSAQIADELSAWVSERLTKYKQPREVHFVASIPRNPSGKILRRELRTLL